MSGSPHGAGCEQKAPRARDTIARPSYWPFSAVQSPVPAVRYTLTAVFTLSAVNATLRRRTPTASKMALEMSGGCRHADGSHPPHGGSFGRLISSVTTSGTSGNFKIG